MKCSSKRNAGFTLVELVVAIAMATIVTAAATSVLLMGLRVNRQTADTASQYMTVRSLLNVMEDAAVDGNIKGIVSDYDSWQMLAEKIVKDDEGKLITSGRIIFGFDSETQMIYTNGAMEDGVITSKGTTILQGVFASTAMYENNLLTVAVETKEGSYASSINCRLGPGSFGDALGDSTAVEGETTTDTARLAFLEILKKEYRSRGEIKNGDGKYTYYSEWYIQKRYDAPGYNGAWNAKTPWCACYVSWALVQAGQIGGPNDRWYADVDKFMAYFQNNGWQSSVANGGSYEPRAGDLIFFDWDKGIDPEHVGVVLSIKQEGSRTMVYTIEGNSAGRVNIRVYSLTDERIIGYGILPWTK